MNVDRVKLHQHILFCFNSKKVTKKRQGSGSFHEKRQLNTTDSKVDEKYGIN
jgi:hypothetical protein